MFPRTGECLVRFVGDVIRFELSPVTKPQNAAGSVARLRTTIGRGDERRREICDAHFHNVPSAGRAWRDLEMKWDGAVWHLDLPLAEVGFFHAKAYLTDEPGWQHWPDGSDVFLNVQPNWCRTANTIYCAFPRMFGPNKSKATTLNKADEARWKKLDEQGYTVIPPSGKLRDVIAELPHIFDDLGCRLLHLLPVGPTPTTMAKFGRFGSPYAVQDLTAVDPALVEFDQRTTGIEQFCELTDAVHLKGGRVLLDLVINHTGWGSDIFEKHPEWFVKDPNGKFVSPGAWGNIWEDLVEMQMESTELWDYLANVFLTWCRRGVDGFRCDAGYKVPMIVWQYITARVHTEFPETVFLLEGLGGGWDDTAIRLTEGGMQWAYSELFQNYSSAEVSHYLDHSLKHSKRVGLLFNYSETHDNDRLAKKGREWSLLRNQLCALTSVSGGFGFTNGVEWLAAEQVNVHSARGMSWGSTNHIVAELKKLNHLLATHPCFFDSAFIARISAPADPVLALIRHSPGFKSTVLVLVNLDIKSAATFTLDRSKIDGALAAATESSIAALPALLDAIEKRTANELLSGELPEISGPGQKTSVKLKAAQSVCLALEPVPSESVGADYRAARARAALAFQIALGAGNESLATDLPWTDLAQKIDTDLEGFVAGSPDYRLGLYPCAVHWTLPDTKRVVPVPPEHWLVIRLEERFSWTLRFDEPERTVRGHAVLTNQGWAAVVPAQTEPGDARIEINAYGAMIGQHEGAIRFLDKQPAWVGELTALKGLNHLASERTVLLTNGRGGMARINLDLGRVCSKYDCLLGANLGPNLPVDRHVFIKRLRLWANADGFVSPLNADNLIHFKPGPPAVWRFRVQAGNGRAVFIRLGIEMVKNENTVQVVLLREHTEFPLMPNQTAKTDKLPLRLTARFDLEDRSFHWETQKNGSAEAHFSSHTNAVEAGVGFEFQPAVDRRLLVTATAGKYHSAPEWCENLPHPVEASRGQTGHGDAWSPGWFDLPLGDDGDATALIATSEVHTHIGEPNSADAPAAENSSPTTDDADPFGDRLKIAASQFVVRRGDFKSVIAGYPWFLDWGRDTLICARGMIAAGWIDEVRQLLVGFGRFEENGTLPNTIHGADASNRDTSDAPLWYGVVAEELAAATDDSVYSIKVDDRRTVTDVLRSIAAGYLKGTPNGIHVDEESGLVWSPSHFTWMDTNYPAGTPREGYPIEIQALWIRLLNTLKKIGAQPVAEQWNQLATKAVASVNKLYWLEKKGWYADSINASAGEPASLGVVDQALRSNCLIPISFGLLTGENARRCVEAARRYLVVPGGLRSLAPLPVEPPLPVHGNDGRLLNDPENPYWGSYKGDEDTRRKPAYHNGTVWTWTFPIFCEALVAAYDGELPAIRAAVAYLGSMDRLLEEGCYGQIPENLDGDAPHAQRGCDAQAWGVTEALRVWNALKNRDGGDGPNKNPQ